MGLFARLISYTPFHKYYKEYNRRKWEISHQKREKESFPLRVAFYRQFINPGDIVFDVGANVGNRVEVFLECGAKVIAIEPQPSCAKILNEKFSNSVVIEQVGLSYENGELEMFIGSDTTVSTFDSNYIQETKDKFKYTQWQGSIKVPVTTLDTLILKHGLPVFCKIDVEGFELNVLKGLNSPIQYISFEYIVPERKQAVLDCLNQINKLSPGALFNFSTEESMKLVLQNWLPNNAFAELVNSGNFSTTSFGDVYVKSF